MKPLSAKNLQMAYLVGILLLFASMWLFTDRLKAVKESKDLGEATIGQIDSGNFMFKIFQLAGARGVAANMLWIKAEELKKAHDWDRLMVNVALITKLQPHFLRVWTFQGWNLAYNVSVEWDAPEDKYHWIKQGIKFLQEGVRKNKRSPDLVWDTAYTYFHKIGFSDESIILRRLFYDDDDEAFRTYKDRETGDTFVERDNFLLAYGWFKNSVAMVDRGDNRLVSGTSADPVETVDRIADRKARPDDLNFRSMPPHARTRYAAGLEKASVLDMPATFSEKARVQWETAYDLWHEFGKYPFPAHNDHTQPIYLNDALDPKGLKDHSAGMPQKADNQKHWTYRWAGDLNFPYWKDRSKAESEPDAVRAHNLFYNGILELKAADFPKAVDSYRKGLDIWRKVMDRHPIYMKDDLNKKDTGIVVKRYLRALTNAGMERPKEMPFEDLLKAVEFDTSVDPFDQNEQATTGTLPKPIDPK